jgi:hypothetical protein
VPIPSRTSSTFAPTDSQMVATALIKLIFIVRKAVDAYLITSADLVLVTITGGGTVAHPGFAIASGRR